MTVKELIERLQTLPPDTPVLVEGYETGFDEVIDLSRHELVRYRHAQPWDGEYQPVERFKNACFRHDPGGRYSGPAWVFCDRE